MARVIRLSSDSKLVRYVRFFLPSDEQNLSRLSVCKAGLVIVLSPLMALMFAALSLALSPILLILYIGEKLEGKFHIKTPTCPFGEIQITEMEEEK